MEIRTINLDMYRPTGTGQSENTARSREISASHPDSAPISESHGDRVSVSREAVLRTEAFRTATSSADIRQHKVDFLKEEIASGRYQINSRRIAAQLLQSEAELFRL